MSIHKERSVALVTASAQLGALAQDHEVGPYLYHVEKSTINGLKT